MTSCICTNLDQTSLTRKLKKILLVDMSIRIPHGTKIFESNDTFVKFGKIPRTGLG